MLAPVPPRVMPVAFTVIPFPTFAEVKVALAAAQVRPETAGAGVQLGSSPWPFRHRACSGRNARLNGTAVMLAVVLAVVEVRA